MYGLSAADEDTSRRGPAPSPTSSSRSRSRRSLTAACSDDIAAAHKKRAIELGRLRHQHAAPSLAAAARSTLQQVLVQEAGRTVADQQQLGFGWRPRPRPGFTRSPRADQVERYLKPPRSAASAREAATRSPRRARAPTSTRSRPPARRDGDSWVLNGASSSSGTSTSYNSRRLRVLPARRRSMMRNEGGPLPTPPTFSSSSTCRAPGVSVGPAPPPTRTRSAITTRSSPSRTFASPRPTWSAPETATGCSTRASGSASSG